MIRRLLAMLHARNLEFMRDRAALTWNILLPVMLVFGLAFIFSGGDRNQYKVAVKAEGISADMQAPTTLHPFLNTRFINFYAVDDINTVVPKVGRHQVDMLIDLRPDKRHYWINSDSPKGYFLERLLAGSEGEKLTQQIVTGDEVRYIDWVVPNASKLSNNLLFLLYLIL